MCPPALRGGISISAARRAKEIVSLRGPPRPGPPAVRGGIRASTGPLVGLALPAPLGQGGWLLPRGAGLRRQGRHPRKANTERRSGRGTGVSGVIPSRFCCPAAIKYPAGAVSSLPVESPAVVPPAAFGGGGNGSGTERRLVLAVGFQGACPWPLFRAFLAGQKGTARTSASSGTKMERSPAQPVFVTFSRQRK